MFNKDLNNLIKFDIQINRIIWFYDYLNENDEEDSYRKNIEDYKKKKEDKDGPEIKEDKIDEERESSESEKD